VLSGSALLDESRHHHRDVALVHRRLAYWIDGVVDSNQPALDRLFRFYRLAAVLLVGAIILWVIAIAT